MAVTTTIPLLTAVAKSEPCKSKVKRRRPRPVFTSKFTKAQEEEQYEFGSPAWINFQPNHIECNYRAVVKNICPADDPIDWQPAMNSCVHRHVYGCKMICGSISKNLRAISAFLFFFFQTESRELLRPADGSCSPMRADRHLGRSEQRADRENAMMRRICAFAAQDFQTAPDVIPGSQEKERTRVPGTSPRGLGGLY